MKNEIKRLLNGRGLKTQQDNKNLTQNLRQWRKDRNITEPNTKVFIASVVEELLEIYHSDKTLIKQKQEEIMMLFFPSYLKPISEINTLDSIKDIKVFSINETELMGYDDIKTDDEVFHEINSRRQDPIQYMEWNEFGHNGQKWKKWSEQPKETLYKANYEVCKL